MHRYRWTARALAIGSLVGVTLLPWGPAPEALPTIPPSPPPGPICPEPPTINLQLVGVPNPVGYPVVGFTVEIDARHVKFQGSYPDSCLRADFTHPLPNFEWSLDAPGSAESLTGDEGLQPHLVLDTPGIRVVTLTACPAGCTITEPFGQILTVAPQSVELTLEALQSARLGPETMAVLPDLGPPAARHTLSENHCGFDAGVTGAQWFAVAQIEGPQDYRLVEGLVRHSRVSRKDVPMNHGSQDFNFYVEPDPQFQGILFDSGNPASQDTDLEIEWERGSLPERYRPTRGDRVSVFGHWIYDCAHATHPEIHPPVGMAVHRPRPILIPQGATFPEFGGEGAGSNVFVPGVITDVYFSTDGGDLMDCSIDTGLRNAELATLPNGAKVPACIPAPSLDRIFEFDIYLPRNPRLIMEEAGVSGSPPVPLYRAFETPPWASPGPNPVLEPRPNALAPTHVHVTIDLRGFTGMRYEKRIVSGWVLPAADNWGLGRWKLRLQRLNVTNDGDGATRGDGDWRLWLNTNNASNVGFPRQEWIQVLDRDVHNGILDFGDDPWETDPSAASNRSLGPDLLRYPPPEQQGIPRPRDYGILFHSTGYEADNFTDDDAGTVAVRSAAAPQPAFGFSNICNPTSDAAGLVYSGCVRYTAYFDVRPGPPLPGAGLTSGAQRVADSYVLHGCARGDPRCGLIPPILAPAFEPPILHPLDAHLGLRSGAALFTEFRPFRPGSRENGLTEISVEEFYNIVVAVQKTDPARVDRMLDKLRAVFDAKLSTPSLAGDVYADLATLEASLPADLWARHFADIPRPRPDPGLPRGKLTGSGTIGSGGGAIDLKGLRLHCAGERLPNRLKLRWGSNRFDLDLLMKASCVDDPAVANSPSAGFDTHRGMGIGRYNGVPGAVVEWTLVDAGEPGSRDSAVVTIRTGRDGALALSGSGLIRGGNLQATGGRER